MEGLLEVELKRQFVAKKLLLLYTVTEVAFGNNLVAATYSRFSVLNLLFFHAQL